MYSVLEGHIPVRLGMWPFARINIYHDKIEAGPLLLKFVPETILKMNIISISKSIGFLSGKVTITYKGGDKEQTIICSTLIPEELPKLLRKFGYNVS